MAISWLNGFLSKKWNVWMDSNGVEWMDGVERIGWMDTPSTVTSIRVEAVVVLKKSYWQDIHLCP